MRTIKKLGYIALAIALSGTGLAQETIAERKRRAQNLQNMYLMAEQAYKDGDIKAARDTINALLAQKPSHAHAIALKRRINQNGNQMVLAKKRRIFNAVMIKVVDYKDLTLAQAIKLLGKSVEASSGGKVIPNFVIQDPKKYLGAEKINLTLNNVPAGVALDHLLKASSCSASFSTYTINIKPKASFYSKRATKVVPKQEETPAEE